MKAGSEGAGFKIYDWLLLHWSPVGTAGLLLWVGLLESLVIGRILGFLCMGVFLEGRLGIEGGTWGDKAWGASGMRRGSYGVHVYSISGGLSSGIGG